jgi:hypothetical protein
MILVDVVGHRFGDFLLDHFESDPSVNFLLDQSEVPTAPNNQAKESDNGDYRQNLL